MIIVYCDKFTERNALGDLRMDYLIGPIHYLEVLGKSLKVIYLNCVLKNGKMVPHRRNGMCKYSLWK